MNYNVSVIDRVSFPVGFLKRLGARPESLHFIQARGDSMHPTIVDGSIVLVDTTERRPRNDAIYVISVDGDVRIKRLQKGWDGSISLISDNKEVYPAERLSPSDAERLRIEGKVLWTEKAL